MVRTGLSQSARTPWRALCRRATGCAGRACDAVALLVYHRDPSSTSSLSPWSCDTSKADVAGGRVDRLCVARGGSVAAAVVRRAQMRAALDHLAWNPDVGKTSIVALFFAPAARI